MSLQSSTGQILATVSVLPTDKLNVWTQATVQLRPIASAETTSNFFTVTVDGASASGQTIFFCLFSLFPPTFRNRPNGMREDIATASLVHRGYGPRRIINIFLSLGDAKGWAILFPIPWGEQSCSLLHLALSEFTLISL